MNDTKVEVPTVEAGAAPVDQLNDRERVIFYLLASGLSNRQIAGEVALAEKTVKNYVTSVLRKLGMRNRGEVVAYVARSSN